MMASSLAFRSSVALGMALLERSVFLLTPCACLQGVLQVFEAKDLLTGGVVALKRIYVRQPQRGISKSTANEVAVLRDLHSDHIVRLLDVHRQESAHGHGARFLTQCLSRVAT